MTKKKAKSLETWNIYPEFQFRLQRGLMKEREISGSSKVFSLKKSGGFPFLVRAGQMWHEFRTDSQWNGEERATRSPELHVATGTRRYNDEYVKITLLGAGGNASRSIPLTTELDLTPAEAREFARALLNAAAEIDFRSPMDE